MTEPFNITAVQPAVRPVFLPEQPLRRESIRENLQRAVEHVLTASRYFKSRICVFPEFFLHGFCPGRSQQEWIDASLRIPGPETEELGKVARATGCYIAGMVYDVIDGFPGRFWNTAIIVDPEGKVALTYRKLYAMTGKTRPGDVYDEYIRRFGGPASLFPVLRTPYGNLGALICYDINFPEVTRCLALQGAEIFLHCSSEPRSGYHLPDGGWELARRVRAYENIAYLAMSNCGPSLEGTFSDRSHGHSQIIDFNGKVMNMAESAGETLITAEIDLEALRRRRARASLNFLAEVSPQLHAPIYAAAEGWPLNHWADKPMTGVADNRRLEAEVIAKMTRNGVFVAPEHSPAPGAGRLAQQE